MCSLTFSYLAFSETNSALAAVAVGAAFAFFYSLFAQPAAGLLRSFDRRSVFLGTNAVKAVNYSAVVVLQLMGALDLVWILVASAVGGLTSGAYFPAWQEILRNLSPKGKLDETDGLFSSASSIGSAVGALSGGIAIDALGAAVPLAINVLSYLPLMLLVARLPKAVGKPKVEEGKATVKIPVRKLLGEIRTNRAVRLGVTFMALLSFFAWPIVSLLPKVASEYGSGAHVYGLLLSAFYLGGILVAGLVAVAKRRFNTYYALMRSALVAIGVALLLIAIVGFLPLADPPSIGLSVLVLMMLGIVLGISGAVLTAVTQQSADRDLEGPVLAFYAAISMAAGAIGGLIEGSVADQLEIWWLPLASGLVILLLLLALWVRNRIDEPEGGDPEGKELERQSATGSPTDDAPYLHKVGGGGSQPLSAGTSSGGS